ncbi:MAG: isoprenyl transferase [Clostridia bacterium]|nr:isoprenyl transferase [Clostridia bacterium]
MSLFRKAKPERILPQHVAIIMDGNGRWAKKRHLPRTAGHAAGSKTFKDIARYANKIGIKYMTVYAFSTENWKRPKEEVDNIMGILRQYLKDTDQFKEENIKLQFIGGRDRLPEDIQELMAKAEDDSKDFTGMHLNIAVNYGGRDEIVTAVKKIIEAGTPAEEVTDELISQNLYTAGQPDPDFIIRPSGEYRLSNYLIWQSAYAEFWFSDVLWPEFGPRHLEEALDSFSERNRRFGGV